MDGRGDLCSDARGAGGARAAGHGRSAGLPRRRAGAGDDAARRGGYTKEEVADRFLGRWDIELDLRAIKCALRMDVLGCEAPEMVRKEIWMHLLGYDLIRGVMARAAAGHDKEPRQLSFEGALQTMTAF